MVKLSSINSPVRVGCGDPSEVKSRAVDEDSQQREYGQHTQSQLQESHLPPFDLQEMDDESAHHYPNPSSWDGCREEKDRQRHTSHSTTSDGPESTVESNTKATLAMPWMGLEPTTTCF